MILQDAKLLDSGAIRFGHFVIAPHALERFNERFGEAANILESINNAGLYEPKTVECKGSKEKATYYLRNGAALFPVRVSGDRRDHHIVTSTFIPPRVRRRELRKRK